MLDRAIEQTEKRRAVLDELFKALLHKLMTGEIRVADLDLSALAPADQSAIPLLHNRHPGEGRDPLVNRIVGGSVDPGLRRDDCGSGWACHPERQNERAEKQRGGVGPVPDGRARRRGGVFSCRHDCPHPILLGECGLLRQDDRSGIHHVSDDRSSPGHRGEPRGAGRRAGVPLADHLRRLLEVRLRIQAGAEDARGTGQAWRDVSGLPDTKPLSADAISRESIYAERG